ncbi:hypothetical protein THOM_2246 [Trachipleistophora hominis]|uniref:Uncharacterized protein n=1 Tax=Trachipleistophora hominis TaxID=72359 RepID=L7JUV7_TRAHO|nr:hypothetical protein THOM_2246 [Trachipleistophora hominis]
MLVIVFLFVSICCSTYTPAKEDTEISSDEDPTKEDTQVISIAPDDEDSQNKIAMPFGENMAQAGVFGFSTVLLDDYWQTRETMIKLQAPEQKYDKYVNYCSTPGHNHAVIENKLLVKDQKDADHNLAEMYATHSSYTCSSDLSKSTNPTSYEAANQGMQLHSSYTCSSDLSKSSNPTSYEAANQGMQLFNPSTYLPFINPNPVPQMNTYESVHYSLAFIERIEQKQFYNTTRQNPTLISSIQPNFESEIFSLYEDDVCYAGFRALANRYKKLLNRYSNYQFKRFLMMDRFVLMPLLTIDEIQYLNNHHMGDYVKRLQISCFIFFCDSQKYFESVIEKYKELHVILQGIEEIIRQASLVNIKIKNKEIISILRTLKNEQPALFDDFRAYSYKINNLFGSILTKMHAILIFYGKNCSDNTNAINWVHKARAYIYERLLYEIIIPRSDNATLFIGLLTSTVENSTANQEHLESVSDIAVLTDECSSMRELPRVNNPDNFCPQTYEVILSYMSEYKKFVSVIWALNQNYVSLIPILDHNLQLFEEVEQVINKYVQ